MKKLARVTAALLVGVMTLTAVACDKGKETTKSDGDTKTTTDVGSSKEADTTADTTTVEGEEENGEKKTISLFVPSRLPEAIYNAETMVFKKLAEELNIDLQISSVIHSEAGNYLTTLMSGGDYPDVVSSSVNDIRTYGEQGAFKPLNEMINAEATPNLQKHIMDNEEVLGQASASDGNVYGVPMQAAIRTAMGYLVRQDWLDKLKLEKPETIEDWHTVLTAFKENGKELNGGEVTPLVLDKAWENYYYNFADAWGIEVNPNNGFWLTRDDKVDYSPLLPETKEFITTMAQWYKEGLIDQDFVTREDTNNYHVLNNLAGASVYWTGYIAGMNYDEGVLKNDPDTRWEVVNPPVLEKGQEPKTYSQQGVVVPYAWGMSVNAKEPDAIMKMFDYVYSDEGSLLFNFGVEGESYEMKDGKPEYTDAVMKSEGGSITYIRTHGMQALVGMRQMPEYEEASTLNKDIRDQLFFYDDNDLFYPFNAPISLDKENKDIYDTKMSAITTMVDEELVKFVIGTKPLSEWDAFVASVESMGIADIIEIMQAAVSK